MLSHVKPLSREQAQRFPLLFSGIEAGFGQILEGYRFAEWVRTVLALKHEGISDEEARGLWQYVTDNPRFAAYELLIDFSHTTEHLSLAADLLFGKTPEKAKRWSQASSDTLLNKAL